VGFASVGMRNMISTSRRSFLGGLGALIAAPAIVRASSLMPITVLKNSPPLIEVLPGFLLCNGAEIPRWKYKELSMVCDQIFGWSIPTLRHLRPPQPLNSRLPDLRPTFPHRTMGLAPLLNEGGSVYFDSTIAYVIKATDDAPNASYTPVGSVCMMSVPAQALMGGHFNDPARI
jgi:hypothetical protein